MDETRTFAKFLAGLRYEDIPTKVVEKVKDHILDQLGVQLAACSKPWSLMAYKYARNLGGSGESTIVSYGDRVRAEHAAFANATFGHGFEMDDTYLPGNLHPGAVIIPTALAMGEKEMIDGKTFITAVIAGYETMGRIGRSAAPSLVHRGFHPVACLGPFAAAAVTGKVLGLDEGLMLNAIAVAGSHASGLSEFNQTGGSIKRIHAGIAAVGGMRSALLAQAGLTGPPTILEGKKGFWHAFTDGPSPDKLTAGLGKEFIVMGTSFKLYACCHDIQAALDITSNIVKGHKIKPDDIEEIVMGGNRISVVNVAAIREPKEITEAQFSAAFTLAMMAVKGSNGFRDYNEKNLKDPRIKKLAQRVRMELDKEVDAQYPATRAARVTIKLKDGTVYSEKVDGPRGSPESPVGHDEIEKKFRDLASLNLAEERIDQIVRTVQGLEGLSSVSALARQLVA